MDKKDVAIHEDNEATALPKKSMATYEQYLKKRLHDVMVHKEYKKYLKEEALLDEIYNKSLQLRHCVMLPIHNDSREFRHFVPHDLPILTHGIFNAASEIVDGTTHDLLGVAVQILNATAIATCGRVDLHINNAHREATCLTSVQVNAPGTRKSTVISAIRKPFDNFQAKRNISLTINTPSINSNKLVIKGLELYHNNELKLFFKEKGITSETIGQAKKMMSNKNRLVNENFPECDAKECMLLADKVTSTGLCKIMLENGEACGIISDESTPIAALLLARNAEPVLFNTFTNQASYVERKGHTSIKLNKPALSIIAFSQTKLFELMLKKEELIDNGALARILLFFTHSLTQKIRLLILGILKTIRMS